MVKSLDLGYNWLVSKKRASVEDVYSMEDSDYRDLMREELMKARRTQLPTSGGIGAGAITLLLLIATAAIVLHHFGIIELPK
jgi:hypothetical protein